MIIIKNITKYVLGEILFEGVSFVLHKGDKVGLVGPNGSGKSTLLKIILGEVDYDNGSVDVENERIGYLPQKIFFQPDDTIKTFLNTDEISEKGILKQVGLNTVSNESLINKLSGGQKTRLAMARVLLQKPSVIILDEPTNHLDIKGLEWLEEFIKNFRGIVLAVSHDRRFLDNSVNKIFEIDSENKKFNEYQGGYSLYVQEREKSLERQGDDYNRQQKEKKRLEQWLILKKQEAHVHPDPAKGKQIRAMERRLEREIYSQEIVKPKSFGKIKGMNLSGETTASKLMVRCLDLAKKFGEKWVLWKINFEVRGEERVLLAGDNGCGKTTLLKIIIGSLKHDGGNLKIGDAVNVGYFAQEHENLDQNLTVIEEFKKTDRLINYQKEPRAILGSFLFKDQDVFKKVSDLSLGEKVRLIFAKLTNQENQLLILDEPTNHLDIVSREIIEEALLNYKGSIIAVSHDRHFIEKIKFDRILNLSGGIVTESFRTNN